MALINCPECNGVVSDKAHTCPHCGYPLEDMKNNNKTLIDCPNCGEKIDSLSKFCPECGISLKKSDVVETVNLIECPQCGKEVSDKVKECPYCEYPIGEMFNSSVPEWVSNIPKATSTNTINGIKFDIEEIKHKLFIKRISNISKKVTKLCYCSQEEADEVVYGYFLNKIGEDISDKMKLKEKIKFIKSPQGKKMYCPFCLSQDIDIKEVLHESVSSGTSEIRKKGVVTRAGNKVGRAGMIMATGGLWALTPKKSDYKEVSTSHTSYYTTTIRTCKKCGNSF